MHEGSAENARPPQHIHLLELAVCVHGRGAPEPRELVVCLDAAAGGPAAAAHYSGLHDPDQR